MADESGAPWIVCPRREGLEYDLEPGGDRLFVLHNATCPDFEIAEAPLRASTPDDSDAAYAVVHVLADRAVATRVAQGINARRFHGRPLQSWVTAMAWA